MTPKPSDPQDWHEKRIQELKRQRSSAAASGRPESPQSKETFAQREKRPGEVGLANEARPGLGTRADDSEEAVAVNVASGSRSKRRPRKTVDDNSQPRATPYAYEEPRPEPREQAADSLAHQQERSTAASGHMGI
jgi:hypothetical protein